MLAGRSNLYLGHNTLLTPHFSATKFCCWLTRNTEFLCANPYWHGHVKLLNTSLIAVRNLVVSESTLFDCLVTKKQKEKKKCYLHVTWQRGSPILSTFYRKILTLFCFRFSIHVK